MTSGQKVAVLGIVGNNTNMKNLIKYTILVIVGMIGEVIYYAGIAVFMFYISCLVGWQTWDIRFVWFAIGLFLTREIYLYIKVGILNRRFQSAINSNPEFATIFLSNIGWLDVKGDSIYYIPEHFENGKIIKEIIFSLDYSMGYKFVKSTQKELIRTTKYVNRTSTIKQN